MSELVLVSEVEVVSDSDGFVVVKAPLENKKMAQLPLLLKSFHRLSAKLHLSSTVTAAVVALLLTALVTFFSLSPIPHDRHHLVEPQILFLNSTTTRSLLPVCPLLSSSPRLLFARPLAVRLSPPLPFTERIIPRDVFSRPMLPVVPRVSTQNTLPVMTTAFVPRVSTPETLPVMTATFVPRLSTPQTLPVMAAAFVPRVSTLETLPVMTAAFVPRVSTPQTLPLLTAPSVPRLTTPQTLPVVTTPSVPRFTTPQTLPLVSRVAADRNACASPVASGNRLEQMVWKLWSHRHFEKAVCVMKQLQGENPL